MNFIKVNDQLINPHWITGVELFGPSPAVQFHVVVKCYDSTTQNAAGSTAHTVVGQAAVDLVMRLCPSALEGKRFKAIRHGWTLHNLFGHPMLQLCSWLGLTQIGFKLHDRTMPDLKLDSGVIVMMN